MKEYIDRIEVMKDIQDGEIEITGEGAEFATQAVESYKAVILRRLMVQETEDCIPVAFIREVIKENEWNPSIDMLSVLLVLWEREKSKMAGEE